MGKTWVIIYESNSISVGAILTWRTRRRSHGLASRNSAAESNCAFERITRHLKRCKRLRGRRALQTSTRTRRVRASLEDWSITNSMSSIGSLLWTAVIRTDYRVISTIEDDVVNTGRRGKESVSYQAVVCSLCSHNNQLAEVAQAPTHGCSTVLVHAKNKYTSMFSVFTCRLVLSILELGYIVCRQEIS